MKTFLLLISALALSGAAPPPAVDTLDDVIKFCDLSLKAYRGSKAGETLVQQQFAKMAPDTAKAVAVVCRAYTAGYDTGRQDAFKNTT